MKQLIYIHGGMCFPDTETMCNTIAKRDYDPFEVKEKKDWFAPLAWSYQIIRPEMPNKNMASYAAWKLWFEKIFPYLNDEEVVLVGHSLWAMFLIKYIGECGFPKKISQLHLISAVFDESDMDEDEKYSGDFAYDPKIISQLPQSVDKIWIYHSTDDDLVPYAHAQKIAHYLPEAKFITFHDKWHFLLPEIPEIIANILAN